jgi:hypothetical protein
VKQKNPSRHFIAAFENCFAECTAGDLFKRSDGIPVRQNNNHAKNINRAGHYSRDQVWLLANLKFS